MTASRRIRLRAHAKINLDLRVLGKRSDGYHELRTILQSIALHDSVTLEPIRGSVTIDGDASAMPLDETNLAWRAAAALWRAAGRTGQPAGARIRIDKRIPSQAGLGGGSTDAAATLVGLNRLWRTRFSRSKLMEIGAHLGADVPFFLVGGTALGLGRGDELYPLADLPSLRVVLAWPDEGVSTADAYGWLKPEGVGIRQSSAHFSDDPRWTVQQLIEGDCSGLRNDLERPVMSHRPRIRRLGRELAATGALVTRMTGSGSTLFALFQTGQQAHRAAAAVAGPGRTVAVTRTVGRLAGGYRVV